MNKSLVLGLMLATGLSTAAMRPAYAVQANVTQVDSNSDGTKTFHFTITLDQGDSVMAGTGPASDFVTVYNFYGFVEGSAKSPDGWAFTSEEFGRTPSLNGYPMVLPVDVPNTPNLTWTATKPVKAGTPIEGFTAVTKSATMTVGEYSAQVTRQAAAIKGIPAGSPPLTDYKQAVIGLLPTPSFLAAVK